MLYSRVSCMPRIAATKYLLTMCTVAGDFVASPYIFTDEELRQISREAQRLGPSGSLRPYTFDTLFSLIAATGMRPSEARNLRLADFSSEGIIVREAKFRKSRFLPLHPSSVASLEAYLERRQQGAPCRRSLFCLDERSRSRGKRCAAKFFGGYSRRAEYQKGPLRRTSTDGSPPYFCCTSA